MKLIQIALFAILYGWIEQHLLGMCGLGTGEKIIAGQFSFYHLVMLALFLVVAGREFIKIPLMILVEDIAYHLFSGKLPGPDDWVNWFLGGFYLQELWIPFVYVLLLCIYLLLEYLKED